MSNYFANGSMFNHKVSSLSPLRSRLAESSPAPPHSWPSSRLHTLQAGDHSLSAPPHLLSSSCPAGGVAAGWWAWRWLAVVVEPWPELVAGGGPSEDWVVSTRSRTATTQTRGHAQGGHYKFSQSRRTPLLGPLPTSAFTLKTLLRHYAKRVLTQGK